jgi:hypothetical protein
MQNHFFQPEAVTQMAWLEKHNCSDAEKELTKGSENDLVSAVQENTRKDYVRSLIATV